MTRKGYTIKRPYIRFTYFLPAGFHKSLVCSVVCLWLVTCVAPAQSSVATYWIQFADKQFSPYSLDHPEAFLSDRAIERRHVQGIALDLLDLPVSPVYIDSLRSLGLTIINRSKWFNAVTAVVPYPDLLYIIHELEFVSRIEKVRPGYLRKSLRNKLEPADASIPVQWNDPDYGLSAPQVMMMNGHFLHHLGYRGDNQRIAILDAGFPGSDQLPLVDPVNSGSRIVSTYDFVHHIPEVYHSSPHGTHVFSIMGSFLPGQFTGTATGAEYLLLITEDATSEYLIEEDHWISAAEYADSAGADVINTSLGYSLFDDPAQDHSYADMNGGSARVSAGADIAVSKGMVVVVSAGNEGNTPWKYITAPADALNILAVGAVDANGVVAPFSSRGPSFDGRVKPDVVAMGKNTVMLSVDGTVVTGSGTSYAAPLVTGLTACLRQAFPSVAAKDLIHAVRQSASHYASPDNLTGYGIPNFRLAYRILEKTQQETGTDPRACIAYPNPFSGEVTLELYDGSGLLETEHGNILLSVFSLTGEKIYEYSFVPDSHYMPLIKISGLDSLSAGSYLISITTKHGTYHTKLVKIL